MRTTRRGTVSIGSPGSRRARRRRPRQRLPTDLRAEDIQAYGKALNDLASEFDKLYGEELRHLAQIEKIDDAYKTGAIPTLRVYQDALDTEARKHGEQVVALEREKAAQDALNASYKAAAAAAPTPMQSRINAATGVGQSTGISAADIEAMGRAMDEDQAKFDTLFAASLRLRSALDEVGAAFARGTASQAVWRQNVDDLTAAYNKEVEAINTAAEAARGANTKPQEDQSAQIKAYQAEVDKLRAEFVPLVALENQHLAVLDKINKAAGMGAFKTQEEQMAALLVETQRYDSALQSVSSNLDKTSNIQGKATVSSGQLSAAVTNLGFQINDIASGLLSGQSPFTIMVQQGGQVIQAFTQGGGVKAVLGGVVDSIKGMINPATLAAAATAALVVVIALLAAHAAAVEARVRAYTVALKIMGEGNDESAKNVETVTKMLINQGVAAAEAEKAMRAFISTPGANPDAVEQLAKTALAISKVKDLDFATTMDGITKAVAGSASALEDYNIQIGVKYTEAEQKALTAAKLSADVQKQKSIEYTALVRTYAKGNEDMKGDFDKTTDTLRTSWNRFLDLFGPPALALVKGFFDLLNGAVKLAGEGIQKLVDGLTWVSNHMPSSMQGTGLSPDALVGGAPNSGEFGGRPSFGPNFGSAPGGGASLRPDFATNLQALIADAADHGIVLGLTRGASTFEHQQTLYQADIAAHGGKPSGMVAPPETSMHVDRGGGGVAADLSGNAEALAYAAQNAARYQMYFPMLDPNKHPFEPWHIEPFGTRTATGAPVGTPQTALPPVAVPVQPDLAGAKKAIDDQAAAAKIAAQANGLLGRAEAEAAAQAAAQTEVMDKNWTQKDKDKFVTDQVTAAMAKWDAALAANLKTQDLQTQGVMDVADAYQKGEVPGIQAAAKAQAEMDVRMGNASDVQARYNQLLAAGAAEAIQSAAKAIPALGLQLAASERLADAATRGAGAEHEMELQNQATAATHDALAKAEATGNEALIKEAKALTDTTLAIIKKNDAAQTALQLQNQMNANKDQMDVNKLEAQYAFQTSEEIQRQVSLLQAKQLLQSKGVDLSSKEAQNYLANVDAMGKSNVALAEMQRSAQRLNDVLTGVGQTIDQEITQNVANALDGKKITSWHTIFHNALIQLELQLISMSIIKPAIGSLLGILGFGGAASNFGSFFGGGQGVGLLSGIFGGSLGGAGQGSSGATGGPVTLEQRDKEGNLTGTLSTVSSVGSLANTGSGLFGGGGSGGIFGGLGNFLNNNVGTSLGFAPTGLTQGTGAGAGIFSNAAGVTSDVAGGGVASGLFGGTTLTGFLGGVGAGATVGSLANMFIGPMIGGGKSTGGMIGSTGGALAGAIIGSIVPGIGTLLGGIIGGAGGGLLGGFFGAGKANNAGSGSLNLATGQLGAFTSGGVAANDQQAQGILQPISTALSNITGIFGQSVLPQATLIAQAGSRDGIKVNIASGEGVKSFTGSDAGAVVQEVAQFLFEHRDLSGLSPTLQKAVGSLDINQIQDTTQLTTAVNFSKIYDSIVTAADAAFQSIESGAQQAGPFEQAMSQITDTFAQLTTQAQQYGLSIDPINAALAEATKRINVDFAKAVDAAYNTATGNDFLNGVQSLVDNYASMAREASAIGASTTVFDKLGQTFDASLKTMFAQLNSTQLNAVIAAFGDLGNDLPALAASARDAALASEALIAAQNQQAQIYQNQQDSYTAANQGFLAQLRDLDKARIATQATNKSLGLGPDQDAQVQETEHRAALNILMALTNDQMELARSVLAQLNPAFAAWVDEAEAAVKATNDGADASARAAQVLQAQASIQAYLNQLQTQSSVFTSGKSRLDAAQSQYNTMLAAAQGGDVTALQGITTAAQTLLQNVSDYYASSAPGQAIFKQVQDQLTALLGTGLTTAPDKTTTDVVNAITDDTATTTTTSNNNTISLITAGIDTAKQITDNAISTSAGVIAAANTANDNLVNSTITTGAGITQATLDGAASIVGGTAQQFTAQTVTLMTGTGTVVEATTATTAAVVSSGTDIVTSTTAMLNNNVTNAANLIASNSSNAVATINANTTNAAALQAAGAAQTSAIIDGNTSNANTLVTQAAANTNTLIATNDNHTAVLAATAQATTNQSVTAAQVNTNAIVAANDSGFQSSIAAYNVGAAQIVASASQTGAWGKATVDTINGAIGWLGGVINDRVNTEIATIANWSNAVIANQVAWDNAINGTIATWLSGVYTVTANGSNGVVQAVYSAADSIVGTIAGWENAVVGSVWGAASSVIANEAVFANSDVAAIYGAANGIVATVAAYENATRASVDAANNNVANWLNNVNGTIVWSINNVNDRSNEIVNKLQEILNNMVGWNQNIWNQLHWMGEYIQLLTEVTINFDEFMAGSQGANTDIMNQIQNTLRRQAFG